MNLLSPLSGNNHGKDLISPTLSTTKSGGGDNKVMNSAIDRLINRKLDLQVHLIKQQTNKEISMIKADMPAVK